MNFEVLREFLTVQDLSDCLRVYNNLSNGEGWESGRQGNGYEKLLLASSVGTWRLDHFIWKMIDKSLGAIGGAREHTWDCWLIRMGDGAYIRPHKDPSEGGNPYRLNTLLLNCDRGGMFSLEGVLAPLGIGDALKFRPDLDRHEVSMSVGSTRVMFSVGCILPARVD